jgi:two-component system sensor histidine kinase KdpD
MEQRIHLAGRMLVSLAALGAVTAVYASLVLVNPTTIALSYVVVVLLIATRWGIVESTVASLAAVLCFNFFFLPPIGTLTIVDPQNWIALVAFLLTAMVASQLSVRARQRNVEALARQRDLERLYALSRAMLLSEAGASLPGTIARHIADAFELEAVGVYDQRTDVVSWAGRRELPERDDKLRDVARRGVTLHDASGLVIVATRLGSVPTGSVALLTAELSDPVLYSVANLTAIAFEQARGEEAAAQAEAARRSSELRATVLDALAHEFKTPLTSMKAASSELVHSRSASDRDRELAAIVDEELDRFQALVTDAVRMLRIDAGDFAVHVERHDLNALVASTLGVFERRLDGHNLAVGVPRGMMVDADRELLGLALRQLVDNALKYSSPGATIEIQARSNGDVDITVRNSGSTIPEKEQTRVLERFYRGSHARNIPGTGMGLAIVQQIAVAHGGALTLASSPDTGTAFTLSLPRGGRRS